jgi:hypothetical protein
MRERLMKSMIKLTRRLPTLHPPNGTQVPMLAGGGDVPMDGSSERHTAPTDVADLNIKDKGRYSRRRLGFPYLSAEQCWLQNS